MKFSQDSFRCATLALAAAVSWLAPHPSSQARTLLGDYQFQQVYTPTEGTLGALTPINPPGQSFVTDTVNGQSQFVLQTQTITTGSGQVGSGVQTPANPFPDAGIYSVVLLASFNLNAANLGATKVFDSKGLTTDAGVYIDAATGAIQFADNTGVPVVGGTGTVPAVTGTYFH